MHSLRIYCLSSFNDMFLSKTASFIRCLHIQSVPIQKTMNSKEMYYKKSFNYSLLRFCYTFNPPNKNLVAEIKLKDHLKDPENEKQFKTLQLEIEIMRQNGENIPDEIRDRDWLELILLTSRSKRRRYLDFIFGIEKRKINAIRKKKLRWEELGKKHEAIDSLPDYLQYKLGGNSPFLRFRESHIRHFYNWNAMKAMMFGQKLIIDCGFEKDMTRSEVKNCAKQLQLSFAVNRVHDNPFDLIFSDFDCKGLLHEELHSYIPTMHDPDFPLTITSKSYLELVDKRRLVYLTPDCRTNLSSFNTDDVYIVGGLVDKNCSKPLTLAKAKRDGIRMSRLPIEDYLNFGSGSHKCLTLNQMLFILADLLKTQNWQHALRHVPRRKLFENRQLSMEKRMEKFLEHNQMDPPTKKDFSISNRRKFRE